MRVRTPSRLHITLIDLNGAIGRIDGGVGLTIDEPYVMISAEESEEIAVEGGINTSRFASAAEKMMEVFGCGGLSIEVISDIKPHVGLGSGTQISLAVGKAYSEIYGLDLSIRRIAEIMGRGGTSGIGVAAFEFGGFIVDGGHSKREKSDFLPSSASKARPAPLIARHDFPDWKVVVAVPELSGVYGTKEVNLFREACPIPLEDVREICHLVLMKLLPGVVEADLDEVAYAIRRIQQLGFKRAEVERYGDLIKGCFDIADCIGMSSTGPAVYAITDSDAAEIAKDLKSYFAERSLGCDVFVTRARNRGAEIEV